MSSRRSLRGRIVRRLSQMERTRPNTELSYRILSALCRWLPGHESSSHAVIREQLGTVLRAKRSEVISFLTIGAFDGKTGDPLYPYIRSGGWNGGLVEPHPDSFERLLRTYHDVAGLWFRNVAVADTDGDVLLYCNEENELPDWNEQTFSLTKAQHARAARIPEHQVASVSVPATTLATLFRDQSIDELDVLHIDAEGSDCDIVNQLLETRVRPRIIIYENAFVEEAQQDELCARLEAEGYALTHTPLDSIAIRS